MSSWSLQVPSFSLNFMTILIDNRGTGKTDAPDEPFSIETMADDTAKLLEVIGVESSSLVGFGMGGRIALEMAVRHPSKVQSMVICSCAAKAPPSEVELLQTMRAAVESGAGREEAVRQEVLSTFSPGFFKEKRMEEGVVRVRMARMRGTSDQSLLHQIKAVLDHDARARLHQIKCPTLVIAGKSDRLVPPKYQQEMAGAIPGASFLALDSPHNVLQEAAKSFNENGIGFLMEQGR
jgi:pimeloyl-ACP methyl ester carboxylesterase